VAAKPIKRNIRGVINALLVNSMARSMIFLRRTQVTKKTLMTHGEVQKLMTNEMRPWPKGVPASGKGEATHPKGAKGNEAPNTSADKRRNGGASKANVNDPRAQYQKPFGSKNRTKPFDAGGL
jgi:hypothetical protein